MPILTTDPSTAAAALGSGRLAALPTETVYGLAVDANQVDAVRRCFEVKGRPADHPVIIHIAPGELNRWAAGRSPSASALTAAFWPGPLTVVVRKPAWVSPALTGGQPTVALRSVDHPAFAAVLAELAERAERAESAGRGPVANGARRPIGLAAPSANRFGRVSPTTAQHVLAGLGDQLDAADVILDGGPCAVGVESTIVDCTTDQLRVLRPGAIGVVELMRACAAAGLETPLVGGAIVVREALASELVAAPGPTAGDVPIRVPGSLRSHYSPKAVVRVVTAAQLADLPGGREAVLGNARELAGAIGLVAPAYAPTPPGVSRIAAPGDSGEFARGLYAWMRQADELGCVALMIMVPTDTADGLSVAIADRVRRAAVQEPQ